VVRFEVFRGAGGGVFLGWLVCLTYIALDNLVKPLEVFVGRGVDCSMFELKVGRDGAQAHRGPRRRFTCLSLALTTVTDDSWGNVRESAGCSNPARLPTTRSGLDHSLSFIIRAE
jgi:hypothetical protein